MKDEHKGTALFGTGGSQEHRWPAGNDHGFAACASHVLMLRSLQTRFSRQRVPGFRTRVRVYG